MEDIGSGVRFNVFVYNVQPGIEIDYTTGESRRAPDAVTAPDVLPEDASYVLNKNSLKFHLPSCESVSDMAEKNRIYSSDGRDSIINSGYVPCKRCNP